MTTLIIITIVVNVIFIGGLFLSTKIRKANMEKDIVDYDYKT